MRKYGLIWVLCGCTTLAGCSIQDALLRSVFVAGGDFTTPKDWPTQEFVKHTDRVYSFRRNFYRTLIIDTTSGMVVIDPMNPELAAGAKRIIERKFKKPVHTLIYSHYHIDHVRGGSKLAPRNIIAHKRCDFYWKQMKVPDLLKPTRTISGDTVLKIGGVKIIAHYHGLSHTDTLYSFYLPDEKLVYTPDIGFVKAVGIPGPFHTFYYGYKRAMERIVKLPFEHYIPSHGAVGTHKDFEDALAFYVDLRRIAAKAVRKHGYGETREELGALFDTIWPELKRKYGHLRGFNEMGLPNMIRHIAGESLGY